MVRVLHILITSYITEFMQTPNTLNVVVPAYNEEATIHRTLSGLWALDRVPGVETGFTVVDNGSTDGTRRVITAFMRDHDGFPLTVIEEEQKGTGAASDTGFRSAVEAGADIVARTDADSCPRHDWLTAVHGHMSNKPEQQMIGGKIVGLQDEYYRKLDDALLLKIMLPLGRVALSLKERSLLPMKYPFGANMAIRASAYAEVGGFPRTSIADVDEDKILAQRVADQHGVSAVALHSDMVVASSMRRIRALGGYKNVFLYYFYGEDREKRASLTGAEPDVR
jgi:cellulose synthase/poly-beta-1,6-N-acetylglucosamine synthase-like glycosyltransferase